MSLDLLAAKKKKKKRKKDPKYVHEKYKEILKNQKEKDEGKAKAVAWSIYCRYKNPGSPRCSKKPEEYLTKKAYKEEKKYRKKALLTSAVLDQLIEEGLLKSYNMVEEQSSSKYVEGLVAYMWTTGKIPVSLVNLSSEAAILGAISYKIHAEPKPRRLPTKEEKREAYKILRSVFVYLYKDWSTKVWSRVFKVMGSADLLTLSLEMLAIDNKILYATNKTDLIRVLFEE